MDASGAATAGLQYDWERFWVPRDRTIVLTPRGYLLDPKSEWARLHAPHIVPLAEIERIPCLALLGEPGMGKTTALQEERDAIDERIVAEGGVPFWLRLRSYTSDILLVDDLFASQLFTSWVGGEHVLSVFLDDFDECRLRIETLASLLVDRLGHYPIEAIRQRLRLRIACRTAAWPSSLEDGLKQLWGDDAFAAYELAPLREEDVASAATTEGLEPGAFLIAVDRAEAAPLASRPLTLDFLLKLYSKTRRFPDNRTELYTQGCELLCREPNRDRRDAGRFGMFSPRQRLEVAGRIAAATVFAGRYAIIDEMPAVAAGDILSVEDLTGSSEFIDGEAFTVDEAVVRETLHAALYSGRGIDSVGWAHQALAEFLAARYLSRRDITLPQVMSLLVHPDDSEAKIAPQLRDVAAWVASIRRDVFREILRSDPEVLLLADLDSVPGEDLADLVAALLNVDGRSRLVDRDWGLRRRYDRLRHDRLPDQLRAYILDSSKSGTGRELAVEIAEACELRDLQDELVDIAVDPRQPLDIRITAAYSIVEMGDEGSKGRLKPLVTASAEEDPLEELKGYGLRASWPSNLSA